MTNFNPKIDKNKDVVFFPFTEAEVENSDLIGEYMRFANMFEIETVDLDDVTKDKPNFEGNLIIFAHGTNEENHKHKIYCANDTTKTPTELAKIISDMDFPKGNKHQIIVWSCHSGIVCGVAQLLALHLIKRGYIGKQVWGCNMNTGTISENLNELLVNTGVPQKARQVDVTHYIGA